MAAPTVSVSITSQTTTTKVSPNIHYDSSYFKSVPGIIKIAQCLISLIGFICVQTVSYAYYSSAGSWFGFVSMTAFWVTLLLILGYMFHIIEKLHFMPWLMIETIYAAIWTVFFFIAGCVAGSKAGLDAAWGAAAFFAFVAMLLFGYEAFEKYKQYRGGEIAQGERTIATSTTNVPSSAPSYPTY